MHILAVLSLITATFFSPMVASKAEAQCPLCGVVGFALGSASNDDQAGASSGSNIIYVTPHIGERIADPLAVRIAVSPKMGFSTEEWRSYITRAQSMTLQEIFEATVPDYENFTILEIARVIQPDENRIAVFWFAYIENEKMRPLSALSNN